MFRLSKLYGATIFLAITLIVQTAVCQVRLPRLISDGMILQRDIPIKIWGWAYNGEKVTIRLNNQSFETTTGDNGKWQIIIPAHKAGGPYNIDISATNQISLKNILFGDVWLCSGQSNMEYPMNRLKDRYSKEIQNCTNNYIRQFKIPLVYEFNIPKDDYPFGNWEEVNPKTILDFSAVAYFFALELNKKYHVPIGIINASVGGSPAEAWMSAEALKEFPAYLADAERCKDQAYINQIMNTDRKNSNEWYGKLNTTDKGLTSLPSWKDPLLNDTCWPVMNIPGYWADNGLGMVNGVVWFRKEIELPSSMTGKPAWIQMGRMVDADSLFINGTFVGTTSYQYPQRKYEVPAGILKTGKNMIVVRLISNSGKGGFIKDKPYKLFTLGDTISLSGEWKFKLGATLEPYIGQTFFQYKPTGLFNGMLSPAVNYAIKGVAWYQGESNTERYQDYQKLLTSLIHDWRTRWNQGNFPFIIAQLPNLNETIGIPAESNWASLQYAQLRTVQTVDNTAITVNNDLGEWNDIHPQNKLDVGKRLALAAEKLAYGDKNIVASGPTYQSMKIKGNKIELSFTDCGDGLISKNGGPLKQFAIAKADKKFVWANATIKGNKIIVWNDTIDHPVAVRYAWADNPDGANLYNKNGLPASLFYAGN